MVAELRYRSGFQRSPDETGARGRTQTPVGKNDAILGFSSYLHCGLLLRDIERAQAWSAFLSALGPRKGLHVKP